MSGYSIGKILPERYSDKDWENYFLLREKVAESSGARLPFESWEHLKENSLQLVDSGGATFLVEHDSIEVGYFIFDIGYKTQPEKRFTYFRNGLISKVLDHEFLKHMFSAFLEFDAQSKFLAVESKNGKNDLLGKALSAEVGANVEYFELLVREANTEKIESWYTHSPAKFPNFSIKFYEDIPEDLLEEYCAAFTELLHDMPANSELGDMIVTTEKVRKNQLEGRKQNRCSYRYLVFNEDNELIAKTNVAINKNKPELIHQYMTGVLKDYRGLGLSKWIKAAMFKKLVADFPTLEKIETDTSPENHASRELSKQMGFKKTGYKKDFLIERKRIEAFLNLT